MGTSSSKALLVEESFLKTVWRALLNMNGNLVGLLLVSLIGCHFFQNGLAEESSSASNSNSRTAANHNILHRNRREAPLRWGKREDPEGDGIDRAARASPLRWGKRSGGVTFDGDDMMIKRAPLRWGKREPLRWGKREPLRWGKREDSKQVDRIVLRASPLRWGKRSFDTEMSKREPLRWGKRDPSRFGKRGPSRFGKREDSMAVLEEPFAYDEIEKK